MTSNAPPSFVRTASAPASRWGWLVSLLALVPALSAGIPENRHLVVVTGAPGTGEYEAQFAGWRTNWIQAASQADFTVHPIGVIGSGDDAREEDRDLLHRLLADFVAAPPTELWLVMIGHGTFAGETAKFNLRGPDVSAQDLAKWLAPLTSRLVVLNCASASAPFINRLAAPNRVIVTATRSGNEVNFARFGGFLSRAVGDLKADLDRDGQVSVLEAFLWASGQVNRYYQNADRLVTEHALIDDNGDGLGTPAEWFRGIHPVAAADDQKPLDGLLAHQHHLVRSARELKLPPEFRARRDQLEVEISRLRREKADLGEAAYYVRLETLMTELAWLYQTAESPPTASPK